MKRLLFVALAVFTGCGSNWSAEPCDKEHDYCDYPEEAYDSDGDGHVQLEFGGDDCDDNDASAYPGAPVSCDGVVFDANCDGAWDAQSCDVDVDGFSPGTGDCNDYDAASYPGAEEICGDAVDQDCDGLVDDEDDEDCPSDTGA